MRFALLLVLLSAPAAFAQDGGTLAFCHGDLSQDRQPNFSADGGLNNQAVVVTSDTPPRLRLNTNLNALNPERIILPAQQNLTAMIVNDSAGNGAAHVLGWFYYDELVARGYLDLRDAGDPNDDVLVDSNLNDIPDFHEDLFNLAPPSGPEARPLIGVARRCAPRTFSVTGNDGGLHTYTEPELAVQGCATPSTFSATDGPRRFATMAGYPSPVPSGLPVVGATSSSSAATDYSDLGLHDHLPNLLEPKHALNNNLGLGHLALLTTNDDPFTCPTANHPACLLPASDKAGASQPDGLPDYKASAYDSLGLLKPGRSAAEAIDETDRRVPLGLIDANREIVFFFVAYVKQIYGPATDSCFRLNAAGTQCNLWFHSDINVFFSKTALNMDLHQVAADPIVTTKNLGTSWLNGSSYALLNTPTYGNVVLPSVNRQVPAFGRRAAHTIIGAPPADPTRWILGWEDQTAGGDRTYSDIVILINKQNNGAVQSGVVSQDLSPAIAVDFTITQVTFAVTDKAFDDTSRPGACGAADAGTLPSITYFVALDCKTCTSGCTTSTPTFTPNPSPTWLQVPLAASAPGAVRSQTVTIDDFLSRGFTGSQLCWRAELDSPREGCEPAVHDVFVSYKAKKAGNYARSTIVPIANAIVYGTYELPGRDWYDTVLNPRLPTTRLYDGQKDLADRGHVWFKSLYSPSAPSVTALTLEWEAGRVVSDAIGAMGNPVNERVLYSRKSNGTREEVKNLKNDLFADASCGYEASPGNYLYDLDRTGPCAPGKEKKTLVDYIYGWENAGTSKKRASNLGGINLSTPAVVGPPGLPPWFYKVPVPEQLAYQTNFLGGPGVSTRSTVTYVGTNHGYLEALDTGAYRGGDDGCTVPIEQRGYFAPASGCGLRRYGTGAELWAYLPGKLLSRYLGNYMRWGNKALPATIPPADQPPTPVTFDGSPAIADVDLGYGTYNPRQSNQSTQPAWKLNKNQSNEGGKTVLVTAAGSAQSVFLALDITDPADSKYPLPMWEFSPSTDTFSLGVGYGSALTIEQLFSTSGIKADVQGTRFSPAIGKLAFGPAGASSRKWSAVFVSDYRPKTGTNPTVFLVDVKTGVPVQVDSSLPRAGIAGVVTLGDAADTNAGVGGEPAIVDLNDDGIIDLVYVALTNGNLYRVNLGDVDATRPLGKVISSCLVANTRAALTAAGVPNPSWQGIYSNLAVKVVTGGGARVRLYYGTANDPENETEPGDLASPRPSAWLFGWEDTTPLGACAATRLFAKDLGPGQAVWGGVVISKDAVTTATAVGTGADLCALDGSQSGKVFSFSSDLGTPLAGNGTDLGGHAVTAPVSFDEHLFILTADAKVTARGTPTWNNKLGAATPGRTGVVIWDVDRNGKVK